MGSTSIKPGASALSGRCLVDLTNRINGIQLNRMGSGNSPKGRFTVCVEGNIGSGKSTLLQHFDKSPNVKVLAEPIEQWTNVGGHNALELLYKDPKRWSFTFNTYVQLTRMKSHRYKTSCPVKLLERSLYSTRYVFVENSFRTGDLTDLEYEVLNRWFTFLTTEQKVRPDLFVYLRASPEVCYERIKARARKEEECVPLEFIAALHSLHEDWLIEHKTVKPCAPVLVLDAGKSLTEMTKVYEENHSKITGSFSPEETVCS